MTSNPQIHLPMKFQVLSPNSRPPSHAKNVVFLQKDMWDDWGKYCTQFYLRLLDSDGKEHEIGSVKIGQIGLKPHRHGTDLLPGYRRPQLPETFDSLSDQFFSLGQSDRYYESLQAFDACVRETILIALRDIAFDSAIRTSSQHEDVLTQSLMRNVTQATLNGQFARMALGGARLTRYKFTFTLPASAGSGKPPCQLDFSIIPESNPPTNVHVIIGRNGVGKTHLLHQITKVLTPSHWPNEKNGEITWAKSAEPSGAFANLVAVSFSAFDESGLIADRSTHESEIPYTFIGLRDNDGSAGSFGQPKKPKDLASEFMRSLKKALPDNRRRRWLSAIAVLDSDPVFRSAMIDQMLDMIDSEQGDRAVEDRFRLLSSGHKIVLLTITRLIEFVEEKTLLLMDEPECHLHPPLLSAFIRSVSELLINRNGVAIIATHSPVVLQEVPRSCVWILSRNGRLTNAERPTIETFGENLSVLSREIFQLELTQSGFHQLLARAAAGARSYEAAIAEFDGELGGEAKAVLRAMCSRMSERG